MPQNFEVSIPISGNSSFIALETLLLCLDKTLVAPLQKLIVTIRGSPKL